MVGLLCKSAPVYGQKLHDFLTLPKKDLISQNSIWYQILIDRFAGFNSTDGDNQPKFIGGNIKGIIDKLEYLVNLGIDTLLLSPFTCTTAYHGYHVIDYENVDPHFGDWNDLKNLIHLAHESNIKIIADFVPNHCSKHHPYFIESQYDKNSNYKNWFHYKQWPENYLCFLQHSELPKFNLNHPETADYFMQIALNWCRAGIDGIRIDHVIGVPDNFLIRLRKLLKSVNPEFLLIGEAWYGAMKYKYLNTLGIQGKHRIWKNKNAQLLVQQHYDGILDGVFDFNEHYNLVNQIINNKHVKADSKLTFKNSKLYSKEYILPIFLDNHDLNRFFYLCNNNLEKYLQGLTAIFSFDQPIVLYYGTEIPLTQKKLISAEISHSDLMARQAMTWNLMNTELTNKIKQLINQKKARI